MLRSSTVKNRWKKLKMPPFGGVCTIPASVSVVNKASAFDPFTSEDVTLSARVATRKKPVDSKLGKSLKFDS